MTKRKLLIVSLCAILGALAALGATLAYFTDTEQASNTFTLGNVDILLEEKSWKDQSPLIPGTEIPKDPTVTNVGQNAAYVFLQLTIPNAAAWANIQPDMEAALTGEEAILDIGDKWAPIWWSHASGDVGAGEEKVVNFVYKTVMQPQEVSQALFTRVKLPGSVTNLQIVELYGLKEAVGSPTNVITVGETDYAVDGASLKMDVKAYAIQADNIQNALLALEALRGDDASLTLACFDSQRGVLEGIG